MGLGIKKIQHNFFLFLSWSITDTNNENSNIQITGFNIYNNNLLLKSDLLSNDSLTYTFLIKQIFRTILI